MKVAAYSIAMVLVLCLNVGCSRLPKAPADPTADNLRLTSLSGPLPREAFKAQLSLAYEAPAYMHAGEKRSIHLLVKNSSPVMWPYSGLPDTRYEVHAGNRWIDSSGTAVEDSRGLLSYDVRPGDTIEVAVLVNAPEKPGEYILEFDMVQEYLGWFKDAGSETLRVKVGVQ